MKTMQSKEKNQREYSLRKQERQKEHSVKKSIFIGFCIGIIMPLIPVFIYFVVLILPRLVTYLYFRVSGGDYQTELLIVQRFTRNWGSLLTVIAAITGLFGALGAVNGYLRKLSFRDPRALKYHSKGIVPCTVFAAGLFIFLVLNAKLNVFGITFLSVLFGLVGGIAFMGYYTFLEDAYYKVFVFKEIKELFM
ncbi:MAG TPA: hypothetical protein PKX45_03700 [Bacillota bacterium]|nr:hypothetical protein [Bacillota bacterium]